MRHAAAHGTTPAKGRPLVDEQLLEHEVVAVEVEVVLGVGGGRLDRLGHVAGGVLGRELEVRQSVRHLHPFDGVGDQARLARRPANKPLHSGNFHRCQLSLLAYLTVVVFSVWVSWPRKCRVGVNSPNICSTMFSLKLPATCTMPTHTAILCP